MTNPLFRILRQQGDFGRLAALGRDRLFPQTRVGPKICWAALTGSITAYFQMNSTVRVRELCRGRIMLALQIKAYVVAAARVAEVDALHGGFGCHTVSTRPKRRFVNFSGVCVPAAFG